MPDLQDKNYGQKKARKLYCYVDETGQDTDGKFFIVVAIVIGEERDRLVEYLEQTENRTGKRRKKWLKSKENYDYIESVLSRRWLDRSVFYQVYGSTDDFEYLIVEATVEAIRRYAKLHSITRLRTTVYIDGLKPKEQRRVATHMRRSGLYIKKVQGIRDESNAIVRLADTVAGLIREAQEGNEIYRVIEKKLKDSYVLTKLE